MTSNRFYIEEKLEESATVFLRGKEHHHLSKVARVKPGELVWLFDKFGVIYKACVEEIQRDKTRLLILETEKKNEPRKRIILAQVMLKAKKMDLVIQKATELGTFAVQPVISDRTIVKLEDRQNRKMDRWKRIMIEAAKQSGLASLPEIYPALSLKAFLAKKQKAKKFFLSERGGEFFRDILIAPLMAGKKISDAVILLIGPEGGWTEKEEEDIMESHYEAVSLGSLTLRSETAAIVSLAMVSHFWK